MAAASCQTYCPRTKTVLSMLNNTKVTSKLQVIPGYLGACMSTTSETVLLNMCKCGTTSQGMQMQAYQDTGVHHGPEYKPLHHTCMHQQIIACLYDLVKQQELSLQAYTLTLALSSRHCMQGKQAGRRKPCVDPALTTRLVHTCMTRRRVVALLQSLVSSRHRMMYSFCSIFMRTMPSTCLALFCMMLFRLPGAADINPARHAHYLQTLPNCSQTRWLLCTPDQPKALG